MGNEGDQQEKDCYHGDEDASRDPRSVQTRPHEKRGNPAHSTHFTDRRGYALWPSSLVWTCPETRCGQCHPQSDEPGHTWYQTTRTPQEDVEPTTEGRHDGRGCDPGYGPRPDGVETEDNLGRPLRDREKASQGEQGEHEITMQRDITVRTTRSTVNNNVGLHVPHIILECCKNAFAYRGPVCVIFFCTSIV